MRLERNDRDGALLPDFRRTRRLRGSAAVRGLVRETAIGPDDFIQPLFITHGTGIHREIGSMPGSSSCRSTSCRGRLLSWPKQASRPCSSSGSRKRRTAMRAGV